MARRGTLCGIAAAAFLVCGVAPQQQPFTVTAGGGFIDPGGQPWSMRGLNATPDEAMRGLNALGTQYPGLTAIRMTASSGSSSNAVDSLATIQKTIKAYTDKGIVVELELHYGNGYESDVGWYRTMASTFKSNPLVFLETPNEPHAGKDQTVANQIAIINAIRGEGFRNPIGVQPLLGWDTSNLSAVVASTGTQNIFATPHIYGEDWSQGPIDHARSLGMFSVIDEFGNSMDGSTIDAHGDATTRGVIAKVEAGIAGGIAWAMDNWNHPDGADSAFATPDGSRLTYFGAMLQPWLAGKGPRLLSGLDVLGKQANASVPAISGGLTALSARSGGVAAAPVLVPPAPPPQPLERADACDGAVDVNGYRVARNCNTWASVIPTDQDADTTAEALLARNPRGIAAALTWLSRH